MTFDTASVEDVFNINFAAKTWPCSPFQFSEGPKISGREPLFRSFSPHKTTKEQFLDKFKSTSGAEDKRNRIQNEQVAEAHDN